MDELTPDDELMTPEEVVRELRLLSKRNFARFARRHGIKFIRFGHRTIRVPRSEIRRVIAERLNSSDRPQ